jgi:hypothetical protein
VAAMAEEAVVEATAAEAADATDTRN